MVIELTTDERCPEAECRLYRCDNRSPFAPLYYLPASAARSSVTSLRGTFGLLP